MKRIEFLLANLFLSSLVTLTSTIGEAQITPDNTLGKESSQIDSNVVINGLNADKISGGATRESNLFHSFSQFNINDGQRVYFTNPSGVINILTRVTGKDPSNIFGTLGVDGAANLFLINPNGILFGKNASLDIQGSFVGTTANGLKFGNQGVFNATNPEAPPLLTINPSVLWFNQLNQSAAIQNNSTASSGKDPTNSFDTFGLRVADGKSLLLVGGDVNISGGGLVAFGGNIDIAGVKGNGIVELNRNGESLSFKIPSELERANISLTDEAGLIVTAGGGGNINIVGKDININNSSIQAGILGGLGSVNTQAGDIKLDAQGVATIDNNSRIFNYLDSGAIGNAGNITINAQRLNVNDGSQIGTLHFGNGNTGNIIVNASESVELNGGNGGFFAQLNRNGKGTAGNISIDTGTLNIRNGAQINSITLANGNAGKIEITARDTVSLSGKGFSRIVNNVGSGAVGNTGGIYIKTGSLFASDEARILSSVAGTGNSGRIFIEASAKVSLTGVGDLNLGRNNFDASGTIFASSVNFGGVGDSGGVVIKTGTLTLDSSQINASTAGTGNSGSIVIEARDTVELLKGSDMFTEVTCACEPNGGGVGGIGNGGDIRITTGSLLLDIGANLRADTEARGNGGNIIIDARDSVTFKSDIRDYSGGAFTQVEPEAVGKGGNITIKTGNLSISGYQEINTRTQGQGDAGNIFIDANTISLTGSNVRIISSASKSGRLPNTFGNGGNIDIKAGSLSLNEGANILAGSEFSRAAAGNIKIDANRITLKNQSSIKSESVADADGGNINFKLDDFLLLRNNSKISTNAGTEKAGGNGGNINIDAPFIVAVPKEDSDITANAFTGNGGNVNIQAENIFGIEARPKPTNQSDITASSELGVQGQVSIRQPDVDPTKGIIELPKGLQDQSDQLGQLCGLGRKPLGRFVITGKQGTLPTNPLNLMQGGSDFMPLATLGASNLTDRVNPIADNLMVQKHVPDRIVEAQALARGADGELYLVADASNVTPLSRHGVPACADVGK
ncbi:filamentous hemagglutinin N-terminal domain-containing protein [Calothrix sp. PCC 6303]|uniref:two-partner secretion domain-containing protein n=1 Tax=Calothrix sp. PCC 6303 TaxID=1170562 RepID=UPI0002A03AE4|nr:filamentous hemagglutinin N-terminal domain-containing protein [Calothrix sp. PCC 6303]AFZ04284.1 filamentous hemagglutinin family outer membrane protein [Calothrix sp. PCC 6303]